MARTERVRRRPFLELFAQVPSARASRPEALPRHRPLEVLPRSDQPDSSPRRSQNGAAVDRPVEAPPAGSRVEMPRSTRTPDPESALEAEPPFGSVAPAYGPFYGLQESPFGLAPDPRFFYRGRSHDRAVQEILTAIGRREGIVVLTGDAGSGKTAVCRVVLEQLDLRTVPAVLGEAPTTVEGLLRAILVEFGVISRTDLLGAFQPSATRHQLRIVLREFLRSLEPLDAFALVFLDHAEKLPLDVLAEVGAVAKDNAGKRSMQLVLAGRSSLLDMLRRQELGWINELVVSRYGLGPLEEDELADYVTRRLTAASGAGQPDVEFKNEALALVYDLTKGSPRLVNQLCDRVLSVSHMESARVIESAFVESAAQALDFARPDEKWRTLRPILTTALIGLGLGAIGAAGWIFRGQIERLVSAWWGRAG